MRPTEVQAEGLPALDQAGEVGVASQKVVDQFAARLLLPADPLPAGGLVAPDEGRDRAVDDLQHGLGSGTHLLAVAGAHVVWQPSPQPPRRRQVEVDRPSRRYSLLRRAAPEGGHGCQFLLAGAAARGGGVGKQRQVFA